MRNNKNTNLNEYAYENLKSTIIDANGPKNILLNERILSKKLKISRSPIKNALSRLKQEGLITVVPRKGIFPAQICFQEYLTILTVREVLEGLAARLAVEYISDAKIKELKGILESLGDFPDINKVNHDTFALANVNFHKEILNLSNNKKLIQTVHGLYDHLRLAKLRTIEITGRRSRSINEHNKIIQALEKRNAEDAEISMRNHIKALKKDIENVAKIDFNKSCLFLGANLINL